MTSVGIERRTLATPGGQLSYAVAGSGPPVLAIQGAGVPGSGWRPQVESLAHQFRLITFDNRGVGKSSPDKDPLTIEQMAGDALAIADAERIDRFHLLGHSMGGLIAAHVALNSRSRVVSLALLNTFANGAHATGLSARMVILGLRSRLGTRSMRRRGMMRMIMPDQYIRDHDPVALAGQLGGLFGRDLADQPPIISAQLHAMSRYSAVPRLRELSGIPTLVMSGAHDPIAPPACGKEIASLIGGARFIEFPDASHALPIQCAAEVNSLLFEHLTAASSLPV